MMRVWRACLALGVDDVNERTLAALGNWHVIALVPSTSKQHHQELCPIVQPPILNVNKLITMAKELEIGRYLDTGEHSDVTIVCGSRSFKVHKIILCAQSEYFRAVSNISREHTCLFAARARLSFELRDIVRLLL